MHKMVYRYCIKEPIFGTITYIFIGEGIKDEMYQHVKRFFKMKDGALVDLKNELDNGSIRGLFNELQANDNSMVACNIYIPNRKVPDIEGTIVHECVHLCTKIFDYIGMEHNKQTDELFAYMMGSFSSYILNNLKKLKEKENELNNKRKPRRVPKSKGKRI